MDNVLSKFKNFLSNSWMLFKSPIQNKISSDEQKCYNLSPDYKHKFTSTELSTFYELFNSICKPGFSDIGVEEFVRIDQMRVNPFAHRICMIFSEDGSGRLTFQKFLNVVSAFSRRTSSHVKAAWIFSLWDFDGDDIINFDDLIHGIALLSSSGVMSHPSKELLERPPSSEGLDVSELHDIAEKVIHEVDPKREGITFIDFRGILMRMPDLITNFDIFAL